MCNACQHSRTDDIHKVPPCSFEQPQINTARLVCGNPLDIRLPVTDPKMGRKVVGRTAAKNAERDIHVRCKHGIHDSVYCTISSCGEYAVWAHLTEEVSKVVLSPATRTIGAEHNSMTLKHINQGIQFSLEKRMTRNGVVDQP